MERETGLISMQEILGRRINFSTSCVFQHLFRSTHINFYFFPANLHSSSTKVVIRVQFNYSSMTDTCLSEDVYQRAARVRVPAKTRGHPQPAGPAGHPQNLLWVRVRVQTQFCGLSAGEGQVFFAGFLAGFSWMNRIFTRAKLLFCTRDIRDMPAIYLVHYMSNYQ